MSYIIIQISVFECKCEQCGYIWRSQNETLPANCANRKCTNPTRWNVSAQPKLSDLPVIEIRTPAESDISDIEGESIGEPIEESVEDWIGWTEEKRYSDYETGQIIVYRENKQTGKQKEIRREASFE